MKQAIIPTAHHRTLDGDRLVPTARITGAMLGLLLCMSLGVMAGCSSKDKDAKGGTGDGGQTGEKKGSEANVPLSADFFPLVVGKERKLLTRKYTVSKTDKGVTYKEVRGSMAVAKNAFDKSLADPRTLTLTLLEDKKGGGSFKSYLVSDTRIDTLRPVQSGMYHEFIKFGATPGDKWASTLYSCEYVRCEHNDGVPCAVLTEVIEWKPEWWKDITTKYQWFLMKGVGIVKVEMYGAGTGERAGLWLPLLQVIYDDWKGDKTPLVIGEYRK